MGTAPRYTSSLKASIRVSGLGSRGLRFSFRELGTMQRPLIFLRQGRLGRSFSGFVRLYKARKVCWLFRSVQGYKGSLSLG